MDVTPVPVTAAQTFKIDPEAFSLVLHVNDCTDDQVLFQAACRKAHVPFNWHVADSVESGISYLKTLLRQSRQHFVYWPDLVLLDVVMPEQNGFEVLKFIRSTPELRHLPVVMFTGQLNPEFRARAERLGADGFVMKPLSFDEMMTVARGLYDEWGRNPRRSQRGG
jgi:CheY-like chemotaxis protein